MPTFTYDIRYLQAGTEVLENFLLSSEIYWPIGASAPAGEAPYPQLTLGGLALSAARAAAKAGTAVERSELAGVTNKIEAARRKWRVAWGKKASQEVRGRLTQWRNFLEDYRENPGANYDRYPYEVFRRVVIQLLETDAEGLSEAEREMIQGLDVILRANLKNGAFVWEPDLQPAFPISIYWYCYGWLPKD